MTQTDFRAHVFVFLYSYRMKLKDGTSYEDQIFYDLAFAQDCINRSTFDACEFVNCDFRESEFRECTFTECIFKDSDLGLVKLTQTRFTETKFERCKIIGVNWTSLDWRGVTLSAPVEFHSSDISFSVFSALRLPGLKVRNCKVHDADFALCDLTGAEFVESDLTNTRFSSTKLNECDFREASNFIINPTENFVVGANFTFPEVLNLLSYFGIKIDNI